MWTFTEHDVVVEGKLVLDRNARGCAVIAVGTALGRLWLEELLQDAQKELNHSLLRQVSRTSRECWCVAS